MLNSLPSARSFANTLYAAGFVELLEILRKLEKQSKQNFATYKTTKELSDHDMIYEKRKLKLKVVVSAEVTMSS